MTGEVPLSATGLLAEFAGYGVLGWADVHPARHLCHLFGERDEQVALAAALAVRALRAGSLCVDVAGAPGAVAQWEPIGDAETAAVDVPAMEESVVVPEVIAAPAVELQGDANSAASQLLAFLRDAWAKKALRACGADLKRLLRQAAIGEYVEHRIASRSRSRCRREGGEVLIALGQTIGDFAARDDRTDGIPSTHWLAQRDEIWGDTRLHEAPQLRPGAPVTNLHFIS